jgi:hypothetical protein
MASDDRYVTLSHCWGSVQIVKLLRSNLEEFTRRIPLSRLPKTFREAIAVTHRLGVRYIWIVSLCIMQDPDDLSDWKVQAALMHKVYTHSLYNISAAAAKDDSQGLFRSSSVNNVHTTEIDIFIGTPATNVQGVRCILYNCLFWSNHINNSPLDKRAWVLQ